MRLPGTAFLAIVVSGLLGGMVAGGLADWFRSGEEFIAAIFLLTAWVLLVAIVFSIVAASVGGVRAVRLAANALAVVAIAGCLALLAFGFWASGDRSPQSLAGDGPILAEILFPALTMVLVQWWFFRRHVLKHRA